MDSIFKPHSDRTKRRKIAGMVSDIIAQIHNEQNDFSYQFISPPGDICCSVVEDVYADAQTAPSDPCVLTDVGPNASYMTTNNVAASTISHVATDATKCESVSETLSDNVDGVEFEFDDAVWDVWRPRFNCDSADDHKDTETPEIVRSLCESLWQNGLYLSMFHTLLYLVSWQSSNHTSQTFPKMQEHCLTLRGLWSLKQLQVGSIIILVWSIGY
jgi:hypothetical protein